MKTASIAVLDIGGTKINVGHFNNAEILHNQVLPCPSSADHDQILAYIIDCITGLGIANIKGIAIGVPSIVDVAQGLVLNATNIAAWQNMPLKSCLEQHFNLPVYINNNVNCFVAGESLTRSASKYADMVGICLGTGLGAGIMINHTLYTGSNYTAGEIGNISYLGQTIEDFCSGQFFVREYAQCGSQLAIKARSGDPQAIEAFVKFGQHLAVAISHVVLAVDPQLIVLGGSVAKSFDLFIDTLWQGLVDFPYPQVIEKLDIVQSELANSALLGAGHLYLQSEVEMLQYA